MEMLRKVENALRLKSKAFGDEIENLIDACKIDLRLAGVNKIDEKDALTERAIVLYCKANFGFDDQQDRYQRAYDMLRTAMALSGDYGGDDNE